nr:MAG TPA: hypothetical protein [Caudoviricetes sp.]
MRERRKIDIVIISIFPQKVKRFSAGFLFLLEFN